MSTSFQAIVASKNTDGKFAAGLTTLALTDLPDEDVARISAMAAGEPSQTDAALKRLQDGQPFNLDAALAEMERAYIEAAISLADGNISQAARRLGINRTTLYSRMEATRPGLSSPRKQREQ